MATTPDYINYVCEQIKDSGRIRYRKMFGEYMVYINDLPILLVCDNTVFVKKLEAINEMMKDSDIGVPYTGAKEHYVLDIDNRNFSLQVIEVLKPITPLPKSRKKQDATSSSKEN